MKRALASVTGWMTVMGLTLVVAGCGSHGSPATSAGTHSAAASSPAASPMTVPAGYQALGGQVQGVRLAVPGRWVVLDLSHVSFPQAVKRLGLKGISQETLYRSFAALKKLKGAYAADAVSVLRSRHRFMTNLNAYCAANRLLAFTSPHNALKGGIEIELKELHAVNAHVSYMNIDGRAGARLTYNLRSSTFGMVAETQFQFVRSQNRMCYVTMSTDMPSSYTPVFNKIGSTIAAA